MYFNNIKYDMKPSLKPRTKNLLLIEVENTYKSKHALTCHVFILETDAGGCLLLNRLSFFYNFLYTFRETLKRLNELAHAGTSDDSVLGQTSGDGIKVVDLSVHARTCRLRAR